LKFDDVMNEQRKVIFGQRREIMEAEDLAEVTQDMRHQVIDDLVAQFMPPKTYSDQWDTDGLQAALLENLALEVPVSEWASMEGVDDVIIQDKLENAVDTLMAKKAVDFGPENMRAIEKQVLLETIDNKWREHLLTLEHLRSVVGFRGYAQRDPLNEYKSEAFQLFQGLLDGLREQVSQRLGYARMRSSEEQKTLMNEISRQVKLQKSNQNSNLEVNIFDENDQTTWGAPGRNDRCPCGSSKKFKHCHGKV